MADEKIPKNLSASEMLEEVLKQFEIKPPAPVDKISVIENLPYILRLWASLTIYIMDPFIPPNQIPAEEGKGGEGGEGGEGGGGKLYAEIILLDNGWRILDYGHAMATSVGENYGLLSTGKYIETCKKMVERLAEKNVKRVVTEGLDIGRFASWIECEKKNIIVSNYTPSAMDDDRRFRIERVFEAIMRREEKLQP